MTSNPLPSGSLKHLCTCLRALVVEGIRQEYFPAYFAQECDDIPNLHLEPAHPLWRRLDLLELLRSCWDSRRQLPGAGHARTSLFP